MHDLSVAESILSIVLEAAAGKRVKSIHLQVGKLQHVTGESLRFSYDLLAAETCADGTAIHIEQMPVILQCKACETNSEAQGPHFCCASCGSPRVQIVSGDEIILDRIELEDGTLICRRP